MTTEVPVTIVWFKRDLRIVDHRALAAAAGGARVHPLIVVEPDLWHQPDIVLEEGGRE